MRRGGGRKKGRVYAVEPVAAFRAVLKDTLKKCANVTMIPYALGREDGKKIQMGLPAHRKYLSHGRTKIVDEQEDNSMVFTFEAEMRNPAILFADLTRLNYIKCDIEGYEAVVIPEMLPLIQRFLPIIQIETWGVAKALIIRLLLSLEYEVFYAEKKELLSYDIVKQPVVISDLIFIHKDCYKKDGIV